MIEFAEFVAKYTDKNKNYKSEILIKTKQKR